MSPALTVAAWLAFAALPAPLVHGSTELDRMDLVVVQIPGASRCSARLTIRAGADANPPGRAGLAHMVEHVAFGAEGAMAVLHSTRSELNAITTADATTLQMDAHAEDCAGELSRALDIFTEGRLSKGWVDRERAVILREQVYSGRATANLLESALWEYRATSILGSPKTRDDITRDDVIAFFRRHYTPGNMALVVVGPLDVEAVRQAVTAGLRLLPGSAATDPGPRAPAPYAAGGTRLAHHHAQSLSAVLAEVPLEDLGVCDQLAVVLEQRLRGRLPIAPYENTGAACHLLGGHLFLAIYRRSSAAEAVHTRAALDAVLDSASTVTAPERALMGSHQLAMRSWAHDEPRLLADRLAQVAAWRRGEGLFHTAAEVLRSTLPDDAELARVAAHLTPPQRTYIAGEVKEAPAP